MLQNEVISTLEKPVWFIDEYGIHNLKIQSTVPISGKYTVINIHAHITPRPGYCDRGHYHLNIDGPFNFDAADRFPRYYMKLKRAKKETEEFLRWRIQCNFR